MNFGIIGSSYDIRGIYGTDINEDFYFRFARAFSVRFDPKTVAVGRDSRLSSPTLTEALIRGFTRSGVHVVDLGICSTDMVSFAAGAYQEIDAAIMVTASHNPKEYNGLKTCMSGAVPVNMKSEGPAIRNLMETNDFPEISTEGKREERNIVDDWVKHVVSFVSPSAIKPITVVADAGNGVAGCFMKELSKALGIRLVPMYFEFDGNFPNHHPSPIEPENMEHLIHKVRETKADLGVAYDGDADRMYICDETGVVFSGSVTTAMIASVLLAKYNGQKVGYNAVCGDIVPETVHAFGGTSVLTKVGHVYVKEMMHADPSVCFSGEHSGHYYFRDNWNADSGAIAFTVAVAYICQSGKKASDVRRRFDTYSAIPETNFRVADVRSAIDRFAAEYPDADQNCLDGLTLRYADHWINIRPSSNEPLLRLNIEAKTPAALEAAFARAKSVMEKCS